MKEPARLILIVASLSHLSQLDGALLAAPAKPGLQD